MRLLLCGTLLMLLPAFAGRADACSCVPIGTRPIAEAAEDLEYFDAIPAASLGGRIYGSVLRSEWDDDNGRCEFTNVPPGTYRIEAIAPPGFTIDSWASHVELRDSRGCARADFILTGKGRGRVEAPHADPYPSSARHSTCAMTGNSAERSP